MRRRDKQCWAVEADSVCEKMCKIRGTADDSAAIKPGEIGTSMPATVGREANGPSPTAVSTSTDCASALMANAAKQEGELAESSAEEEEEEEAEAAVAVEVVVEELEEEDEGELEEAAVADEVDGVLGRGLSQGSTVGTKDSISDSNARP